MIVSKKKIINFFYYIVIFFTVFDGLRNNIKYNEYISNLKEFAVILLLVITIFKSAGKIKIHYLKAFVPFIFTVILGLSLTILYSHVPQRFHHFNSNSFTAYIVYYRELQVFIFFIIYYYYENNTEREYSHLVHIFIVCAVFYVFFTILFYFINFPFLIQFHPYWGRISSGYPTMDAQMLIVALILNFIASNWRNPILKISINSILIFGIIIQATGTGIATLTAFIILYVINQTLLHGRQRLCISGSPRSNFLTLIIGGVIIIGFLYYVIVNYYTQISTVVTLFQSKVSSLTSGFINDKTMQVRSREVSYAFDIYNTPFNLIFGGGTLLGYQVENQYAYLLRSFGLLGLLTFLIFPIYNMYLSLCNIRKHEIYFLLFINMLVLLFTSVTLLYSYLFSLESIIAILYIYVLLYIEKKLKEQISIYVKY